MSGNSGEGLDSNLPVTFEGVCVWGGTNSERKNCIWLFCGLTEISEAECSEEDSADFIFLGSRESQQHCPL